MPPPLTLDDFQSRPTYAITLPPGGKDIHTSSTPPGRQTIFTNAAPSWNQPCTLDIGIQSGKGIFIVNSGFGVAFSALVSYGTMQNPPGRPLGLNLSAYSAFQINLAGLSASVGLVAEVVLRPHGSTLLHDAGVGLVHPPSENPFSITYPWSSFNNQPFALNDIDGIQVILGGGGLTITFGITSFQAV